MPTKVDIKPRSTKRPSQPTRQSQSLTSRAERFVDTFNLVTSNSSVYAAWQKKFIDAMSSWALMKMGTKFQRYLDEARRDFVILLTLRVIATNRTIEQVADDVPFEFPLRVTRKRPGFIGLLPELHLIAAEYEKVCVVAKSAKIDVRSAVQLKLNLKDKLERFAAEEELKGAPTRETLDRLVKNYHLQTHPSDIAAAYVGKRRATSAANIKKIVGIVRDPAYMAKNLSKHLKARYLPEDFDTIKRAFLEAPTPPSSE
jgi:hypothetical protein